MCLTLGGANSRQISSSHGDGGSRGGGVLRGGGGSHGGGGYTVVWAGSVALTFPPGPSAYVGFSLKLTPS